MTNEELHRINRECALAHHSNGTYMNEKDLERTRLVLVVGMKQADVARAEGVSSETISKAIRRARRGAAKLGIDA